MPTLPNLIIDVTSMLFPVLIALLVIWIAGRFARLSVSGKKWWLFAHVMSSVVYFSGLLGMLLLVMLTKVIGGSSQVSAAQLTPFFDWFLIIPGAILSLITGLVLAVRSNWGLTGYYWVIVKWVGNIATIMFGATVMRRWIHGLSGLGAGDVNTPVYFHSRQLLFLGIGISLASLLFLSAISYLKPWGKRTV